MERVDNETAKALHAIGYRRDDIMLQDMFGGVYFSTPCGDVYPPTWTEAAQWLEETKGVIITRVFPYDWTGRRWVSIRVLFKERPLESFELRHAPHGLEDSNKFAILTLLKRRLI